MLILILILSLIQNPDFFYHFLYLFPLSIPLITYTHLRFGRSACRDGSRPEGSTSRRRHCPRSPGAGWPFRRRYKPHRSIRRFDRGPLAESFSFPKETIKFLSVL